MAMTEGYRNAIANHALNNESKKFDADNDQSPLKNLLKPNRRIQVWLGINIET